MSTATTTLNLGDTFEGIREDDTRRATYRVTEVTYAANAQSAGTFIYGRQIKRDGTLTARTVLLRVIPED